MSRAKYFGTKKHWGQKNQKTARKNGNKPNRQQQHQNQQYRFGGVLTTTTTRKKHQPHKVNNDENHAIDINKCLCVALRSTLFYL